MAFITTTVHDPFAGSHTTVWRPRPVAETTQKSCAPEVPGVPPPVACTLFQLFELEEFG